MIDISLGVNECFTLPSVEVNICNEYRGDSGDIALISEISRKFRSSLSSEHFLITGGATLGLYSVLRVLRSSRIMVIAPYYPGYIPVFHALGMESICSFDITAFSSDDQLQEKILKELSASSADTIVLNTPHNPTGRVLGFKCLRKIIELIDKDINIVVDLSNIGLLEDVSFEELFISNNVYYVCSLSKLLCLAGERVGFVMAIPENIERIKGFLYSASFGVPCVSQFLALNALCNHYQSIISSTRRINSLNWDAVFNLSSSIVEVVNSRGSFCIFKFVDPKINAFEVLNRMGFCVCSGVSMGLESNYFRVNMLSSHSKISAFLAAI